MNTQVSFVVPKGWSYELWQWDEFTVHSGRIHGGSRTISRKSLDEFTAQEGETLRVHETFVDDLFSAGRFSLGTVHGEPTDYLSLKPGRFFPPGTPRRPRHRHAVECASVAGEPVRTC